MLVVPESASERHGQETVNQVRFAMSLFTFPSLSSLIMG